MQPQGQLMVRVDSGCKEDPLAGLEGILVLCFFFLGQWQWWSSANQGTAAFLEIGLESMGWA